MIRRILLLHYRLGFLSYKQHKYTAAMIHFQNATRYQKTYSNEEYWLNNQQLYNAHLYLGNSALYIAQEAQESLQTLETKENQEHAPKLQMSPLYEIIQRNEGYIEENAFIMITPEGISRCSKQKCEEIIYKDLSDSLILYFTDRQHLLIYQRKRDKSKRKSSGNATLFFSENDRTISSNKK